MSTLGIRLRELREAKGVSLDDIARSTRVGRRHLEALETDSWAELPAPVFVKGFIRAYCDFLDASPDEALGVYREATGESAKPERVQSILRSGPSRRAGPLVISLVLFIALGASLFALRLGLKSSPPSAPATSASARDDTASVPSSASIPAATAPVIQTQPVPVSAADAKPAAQRLVIHAVEPTWIRVQVDDGQVSEELLPAGAGREWTAARRFVLTVGNAGGLEIDLNGKRMPALGARGVVIQKLVLPPEAQGTGS
ncbi:MAG TPA: RodZ domain-containing protein [Methylomirabilota bacterium]